MYEEPIVSRFTVGLASNVEGVIRKLGKLRKEELEEGIHVLAGCFASQDGRISIAVSNIDRLPISK